MYSSTALVLLYYSTTPPHALDFLRGALKLEFGDGRDAQSKLVSVVHYNIGTPAHVRSNTLPKPHLKAALNPLVLP